MSKELLFLSSLQTLLYFLLQVVHPHHKFNAMLLFCSVRISRFLKQRRMGNPEKIRKAKRVCAAIVAVFVICFLPTTVTTIGVWAIRSYRPQDCAAFYTFTQLNIVSLGLNFLNSALDPVVYVFSSSVFRRALCSSLPPALRCAHKTDDSLNASSTSETQSTSQHELKSINADRGSENF